MRSWKKSDRLDAVGGHGSEHETEWGKSHALGNDKSWTQFGEQLVVAGGRRPESNGSSIAGNFGDTN